MFRIGGWVEPDTDGVVICTKENGSRDRFGAWIRRLESRRDL